MKNITHSIIIDGTRYNTLEAFTTSHPPLTVWEKMLDGSMVEVPNPMLRTSVGRQVKS